jgi:membrane dipeptidase
MNPVPVFDGHNDVQLRLWMKTGGNPVSEFLNGDGQGHLDMPRMKAGGFAGGFFAIFAPTDGTDLPDGDDDEDINPPLAGQIAQPNALRKTLEMASLLFRIEREGRGSFKICRTSAEIRTCIAKGVIAAVFHIEGAEAIDAEFKVLDVLYESGLRSIGPVWSRSNIFGHGVPFRFPSSGDTGDGLTDAGKDLIRYCNERRLLIDLSHLNEKGFWDAAKLSKAPLVATHSNALAICASSRNLNDDQIKAIRDSGGMIGLNFATGFLREDGRWRADTPLEIMVRHLDHLIKVAGENCVALGSDFDGARIPGAIKDAAGLPNLIEVMRERQYGEKLIAKISHENWVNVLERTWG